MMWNYFFKVVWWDESLTSEHGHGAEATEYRAIQATTWANAVEELEGYYGEDLISFEVGCGEYEPILLTEENFKNLWKEHINAGI